MRFTIATTTRFLAMVMLGLWSGPVEGRPAAENDGDQWDYYMKQNFVLAKTPAQVFHHSTGDLAFIIKGQPTGFGFQITDAKQDTVFQMDDAQVTCDEPFSYSIAADQLTFESHAPLKAPPTQVPNDRTWKITYQGTVFDYARWKRGNHNININGVDGTDSVISESFDGNDVTIHFWPGRLPVKYIIGLYVLNQQHVDKCGN